MNICLAFFVVANHLCCEFFSGSTSSCLMHDDLKMACNIEYSAFRGENEAMLWLTTLASLGLSHRFSLSALSWLVFLFTNTFCRHHKAHKLHLPDSKPGTLIISSPKLRLV